MVRKHFLNFCFKVENAHLFRLKTFTDRVVDARQVGNNSLIQILRILLKIKDMANMANMAD